jgi:RHS repeat-associated protein
MITDQAGTVVWRWDNNDPFGNNTPNENPNGAGNFTCNLRLPGQYFDRETGLHYNYFRDYDPAIGRYIESDPIGLKGGINTFTYVLNRPTSLKDPYGLNPAAGCVIGSVAGPVGCGVGAGIGTLVMGGVALMAILSTPSDSQNSAAPTSGTGDAAGTQTKVDDCRFVMERYFGGACKTCVYSCKGWGAPVTYPQAVGKPCPGIRPDGLVDTDQIDPLCRPGGKPCP